MKKLIILTLLFVYVVYPIHASAHVLLKDEPTKSGVVMHVTPEDDPIAGNVTNFYFDIPSKDLTTTAYNFVLVIKDTDNIKTTAELRTTGTQSLSGTYTFPYQGVYELELTALPLQASGASSQVFRYDQRVSRGAVISPVDAPRYAWAEAGVMLVLSLILVILVLMINRWSLISQFTKDEPNRR